MSEQTYATRTDANQARRAESSVARVEVNRANAQLSTGPRTEAGKAAVSTNATKHGLTANLQRLDPRDSPAYQSALADLTTGLAPANPAEEFLIRDLAMLKARLDRIEAAEYATLMFTLDGVPQCPDSMAAAYLTSAPQLANLEKTERFLRRNYMQTWSRLERLQRDRKKQEREAAESQLVENADTKTPKQSRVGSTHSKQEPNELPTAIPPAPLPQHQAPPSSETVAIAVPNK